MIRGYLSDSSGEKSLTCSPTFSFVKLNDYSIGKVIELKFCAEEELLDDDPCVEQSSRSCTDSNSADYVKYCYTKEFIGKGFRLLRCLNCLGLE